MLNWIIWNRTDYLHKMDLALHKLQRLICHKTQTDDGMNLKNSRFITYYKMGRNEKEEERKGENCSVPIWIANTVNIEY